MKDFEKERLEQILEHLNIHGKMEIQDQAIPNMKSTDLIINCPNGTKIMVEFKTLDPLRYSSFLPSLAQTILYFKNLKHKKSIEDLLIILDLSSISSNLSSRVNGYLKILGQDKINWIAVDSKSHLVGQYKNQFLDEYVELKSLPKNFLDFYLKEFDTTLKTKNQDISFSPINQWLLKCLILNGIEKKYWGLDFDPNLSHYQRLAQISKVSESSCFNFLKNMESAGYLRKLYNSYKLLNLKDLFENWGREYKKQIRISIFLTPLLPNQTWEDWIDKFSIDFKNFSDPPSEINLKFLLGGHLSCHFLKISNSNNNSAIFHIKEGDLPHLMEFEKKMRLTQTRSIRNQIELVFHRSDFPIMEKLKNGPTPPPLVDIIQAYLDVLYSGGRGIEQADYIFDKILFPHFERFNWSK
jgi:hypothetical protein